MIEARLPSYFLLWSRLRGWVKAIVRSSAGIRFMAAVLAMTLLGGCQLIANPFVDELVGAPAVTTPSADGVRASGKPLHLPQPIGEVKQVAAKDGTVTHLPLFFEDASEESGSEDGKFAWTIEDYFQMTTWRGRFALNFVLFPISAVVTPPWMAMESDGAASRRILWADHDAAPAVRAHGAGDTLPEPAKEHAADGAS